jgi:hypothetical protein
MEIRNEVSKQTGSLTTDGTPVGKAGDRGRAWVGVG